MKNKQIIRKCEIIEPPYLNADPNPRGGFRGLKGISIKGNAIAIANASTIFIYDNNWNPLEYLWHPICAGIHDIVLLDDCVWVTSSRNDLLLCMDFKGKIIRYLDARCFPIINQYTSRIIKPFLSTNQIMKGRRNFRDPRTHDHTITDSTHLNSLALLDNGDMLISYGLLRIISDTTMHKINHALKNTPFSELMNNLFALYKKIFIKSINTGFEANTISKGKTYSLLLQLNQLGEVTPSIVLSGCTVPSHSVRILQDGTGIYLNTTTGELIHFNPQDNHIFSSTPIGMKFMRGADQLADESLVIGDNNQMIHFSLTKREVISRTTITDDTFEAVFDIKVLPDNFTLPPESFVNFHQEKMPVKQL